MFIFSIAKVVVGDILSHWSCSKDLVHLDSAFCTSASRKFLLDIFEMEYFTIGENFMSTDCLNYVNIRKLKLKTLFLNDDFGSRKLIHDLNVSKVRSLKIVGCRQWKLPRVELVSLFNACAMLSELELSGVQSCCDVVIIQFSPTILSQLTCISITVTDGNQFSDISIQHFIVHCHLLKTVKLNFRWHLISSVEILKLMQSNPHLKHLTQSRRLQKSEDLNSLIDWADSYTLKPDVLSLKWKFGTSDGSFLTVTLSSLGLSLQNTVKKSVSVIVNSHNETTILHDLLLRFGDLSSIDAEFVFISPSCVYNILSTKLVQRNPNLTSLTVRLTDLPKDTQFMFENFLKLKYLTSAGDTYRPRFTISPMAAECENFKLQLTGCDLSMCHHYQTSSKLSQLVYSVPRLKQVFMSNIRSADRPDVETACKARGAELVWV